MMNQNNMPASYNYAATPTPVAPAMNNQEGVGHAVPSVPEKSFGQEVMDQMRYSIAYIYGVQVSESSLIWFLLIWAICTFFGFVATDAKLAAVNAELAAANAQLAAANAKYAAAENTLTAVVMNLAAIKTKFNAIKKDIAVVFKEEEDAKAAVDDVMTCAASAFKKE